MTEAEEEEVRDLKDQVRWLKDALVEMVNEREARRAPNLFAYPWGVKVATRLKGGPPVAISSKQGDGSAGRL